MKLIKHMSIWWLSWQIFTKELKLKWLLWKQRRGEKRTQRCIKGLQSEQITDDNFDEFDEWIPLIRAMNLEIAENIFLGE